MTSYRDMTFCDHWRNCALADKCHRPLTSAVAAAARKWWGADDAPISVFVEKPSCHREKRDD
jgi:hypothetical protein